MLAGNFAPMWNKILTYLYLRKPRPGQPRSSFNLRMMHGINRISIFMFLLAVVVMMLRWMF